MLIVNAITHDRGWSPIQYMVALAGELLECEIVPADTSKPSNVAKILSILHNRDRTQGEETCLLMCTAPGDLLSLLNIGNWRRRFKYLTAWIIDSFWLDHIPTSFRLRNPFDHIFVTTLEDVDHWKRTTGAPTTWLPWGTDVFGLGSGTTQRNWDLTRVGRQPPEWDDDVDAAFAAGALKIRYRGRVDSTGLTSLQNQRHMMGAYAASKFTLAFSNTAHHEPYTHSTRDYLTGRWVDALGCGSVVAGIAPKSPTKTELLWEGATLELGSVRRSRGLEVFTSALSDWTPGIALANYHMALSRLDWRWRFQALAAACGIRSTRLQRDLALLEERVAGIK